MAGETTAPTKEPQWFTVAAGTAPSECRDCKATVYWIITDNDRRMPVDCDVPGGVRPARFRVAGVNDPKKDGRGASHSIDCPNVGQFWRAR